MTTEETEIYTALIDHIQQTATNIHPGIITHTKLKQHQQEKHYWVSIWLKTATHREYLVGCDITTDNTIHIETLINPKYRGKTKLIYDTQDTHTDHHTTLSDPNLFQTIENSIYTALAAITALHLATAPK